VFLGSEVTYDIRLKNALLNVDGNVLSQKGAVEPSVAEQMALGVSSKFSDIVHGPVLGLSTTGLAGPLGEEGKPVGLVYVGLALNGSVSHKKLDLRGSRQEIRYDSVVELLKLVPDFLASTL
jgi:nicotinamide-nucleotide amidase